MAVQNIECQIAKGQMSRYLAGDNFSPDMAVELRAHIAECPECAEALDKKRQILQTMLAGSGPVAAVQMEAQAAPSLSEPLQDDLAATSAGDQTGTILLKRIKKGFNLRPVNSKLEPKITAKAYWRPLALSGGLALVLIAMSLIMSDPTRLFGDRALATESSSVQPSAQTQDPPKVTLNAPVTAGPGAATAVPSSANTPDANDANPPVQGSETAAPVPKNNVKTVSSPASPANAGERGTSPSTKASARKNTHSSRTTPRPRPSGIRVYDANGNPIR